MSFKDHFSQHSANYASARPTYPPELFEFLAKQCAGHTLAWDCATGNGQAAVALAAHFQKVIATDASQAQLDEAEPAANVEYSLMPAEVAPIAATAFDLITVAQALHWFDIESFFGNVDSVLKAGGILAIWSYGANTIDAAVDRAVHRLYEDVLDDYWPPERRLVERAYTDISFPYTEILAPKFNMELHWTLAQLQDYLLSWSATRRYMADQKRNPLELISDELERAWGAEPRRRVCWPLAVSVRKK